MKKNKLPAQPFTTNVPAHDHIDAAFAGYQDVITAHATQSTGCIAACDLRGWPVTRTQFRSETDDVADAAPDDCLVPAMGISMGVVLSAVLWVVIYWLLVAVL